MAASEGREVSPKRSKGHLGSYCHSLGRGGGKSNWEREGTVTYRHRSGRTAADRVSSRDICQAVASLGLLSHLLNPLEPCLIRNQP